MEHWDPLAYPISIGTEPRLLSYNQAKGIVYEFASNVSGFLATTACGLIKDVRTPAASCSKSHRNIIK